jgi:hypothetical protein
VEAWRRSSNPAPPALTSPKATRAKRTAMGVPCILSTRATRGTHVSFELAALDPPCPLEVMKDCGLLQVAAPNDRASVRDGKVAAPL